MTQQRGSKPVMPEPTMPQPTMPQPAMPEPTMQRPAIPQAAMPKPAMPKPAMPKPTMPQEWASFRALLVGRAFTCLAILASISGIWVLAEERAETAPILGLLVALLLLSVPYYALGRTSMLSIRKAGLAVVACDTLLLTFGEYLLGGANAYFGLPLYGILIVMAASLHSTRAAYGIAALGAGSYAGMVTATAFGWIPQRAGLITLSISDSWAVSSVIINVFLGLAMALVAGSLSQRKDEALERSRLAEAELRLVNQELEERIDRALRSERDANRALRSRNSDLEATLRQVDLFASAVSHDLRNPITGAGEALRMFRRSASPHRERLLDTAEKNLAAVDRMVMGLRDHMRVAGARPARQVVAVEPLLREIVRELRASRMDRETPVFLEGSFGAVEASADQLAHVFRNLIGNALEHNEGVEALRVRVRQEQGVRCDVFFVEDNGIGIGGELRAKIFEPFFRGPGARRDGLGLGLSLVTQIVSQAGGEISVDSAEGRGTTFRFTWPAPTRDERRQA
jgi:signal transduction histidine kinase